MSKLKVAVLMGGKSSEHEVSLMTGQNIIQNLDKRKYQVVPIKITKDNQWTRRERVMAVEKALQGVDLAVNAMHGQYGEDGIIQGVLDFLGIPYTGSGVLASALGMNKVSSRKLFRLAGLLIPPAITLDKESWRKKPGLVKEMLKRTKLPTVVKPTNLGSSVGISIVREKQDFQPALKKAFKGSEEVFLEDYINGRELTCGVLENFRGEKHFALPVTEIIPPAGHFFDYQVKYDGSTQEITPAQISQRLTKKVQDIAKRAHQILGCAGYSRADMIVQGEKVYPAPFSRVKKREQDSTKERCRVYLLEVNTLPGFTQASLLPQAAQAAGLEFPQLLDHLIKLARCRH